MTPTHKAPKIIGIAGYVNSGKDTVAAMIKYVTWKRWMVHTYAPHVDENDLLTFTDYVLCEPSTQLEIQDFWKVRAFGDKVKQVGSILTGVPLKHWHDREDKDVMLVPEEWGYWEVYSSAHSIKISNKTYDKAIADQWVSEGRKVNHVVPTLRLFMQNLGTGLMKEHFHPRTWTLAFWSKRKHIPHERYLIPDARHIDEMDSITERGGVIIRVKRNGTTPKNNHSSETSMDSYKNYAYNIDNSGDLNDLEWQVSNMLDHFGIFKDFIPDLE